MQIPTCTLRIKCVVPSGVDFVACFVSTTEYSNGVISSHVYDHDSDYGEKVIENIICSSMLNFSLGNTNLLSAISGCTESNHLSEQAIIITAEPGGEEAIVQIGG